MEAVINLPNGDMAQSFSEFHDKITNNKRDKKVDWSNPPDFRKQKVKLEALQSVYKSCNPSKMDDLAED